MIQQNFKAARFVDRFFSQRVWLAILHCLAIALLGFLLLLQPRFAFPITRTGRGASLVAGIVLWLTWPYFVSLKLSWTYLAGSAIRVWIFSGIVFVTAGLTALRLESAAATTNPIWTMFKLACIQLIVMCGAALSLRSMKRL